MLARILHTHLDGMEELEKEFETKVDQAIASIDKVKLFDDPHGTMLSVVDEIKQLMVDKYMHLAVEKGIDLAVTLKKYDEQGKEIPIDPSKDPTKNEAIL